MDGLDRRAYWSRVVGEQEASGESIAMFCRQRELSQASFYAWRKRLRDSDVSLFVPVSVVGDSVIEVVFRGEVTMRVPRDSEAVRWVVDALCGQESDAC